ncbi:MAG: cation transporter [Burkholderiaceae bacterium]|jgi:copper chaperone|nr:heavy-metal-associated domain-containing protein [Burkholderiales bacterium]MCZ8099858.1 cation transporter [Burkholderiales bacterium]MCZ8340157.1 cation transporter [Burkholderiaceae bacterium]
MEQRFDVQGMTCAHCVRAVTEAVMRLDPAAKVEVDLRSGRVEVDTTAPRERVATAIRDEGYPVAG